MAWSGQGGHFEGLSSHRPACTDIQEHAESPPSLSHVFLYDFVKDTLLFSKLRSWKLCTLVMVTLWRWN